MRGHQTSLPTRQAWVAALVIALALSGCERPLADLGAPSIEILAPDLSKVLTEQEIELRISVTSVNSITEVRLNDAPLEPSDNGPYWQSTFILSRGLNRLIVEAIDARDQTEVDTAIALFLPFGISLNAPHLPQGRGGHTATFTVDRGLLVAGGASTRNGPAHADAFVLAPRGRAFIRAEGLLYEARTGHTATRLPDGRVLLMGGSRTDNLLSVSDLVETAELYEPEKDSFFVVPVVGQPIRRALHSAILRSSNAGVFIDLYGGRGDTRYGQSPFLGVRQDLRTFEMARDTLFALHSLASAPFLDAAIYGHSVTQKYSSAHVVLGGNSDSGLSDDGNFLLEYDTPVGIRLTKIPAMAFARTRHAASPLLGNFLIVFGGTQNSDQDIVIDNEVYSNAVNRFFTVPQRQGTVRRYGHTASPLSTQQVVLIGGFGVGGTAYAASEFFFLEGDE